MPPFESIITAEPIAGTAEDDHAISRSLLERVASGEIAAARRIWRPVRALALTRLDELRPGAADAVHAAAAAGLPTVRRMSGGHAVVLGEGSLCVGIAESAHAFEGTQERYVRLGDALVRTLAAFGIAADQGDLDGEWCPGAWSIRSGPVKLAGLAQRALSGAAWVEAVVELAPDALARELLPKVYDALELPLDTSTFGSIAELRSPQAGFEAFASRLAVELDT